MTGIVGLFFLKTDDLLNFKSRHGIRQCKEFYAQPKDSIDVLFMGSSHIHCDVNTAELWKKYGIAAFDYSAAEQPLWMTYYYIQEAMKYQKPEVVVLDLYSPAYRPADFQYDFLMENLNGMRFSFTKLKMLQVSCEWYRLWDFFPSIVTYHSRYKELTEEDWEQFFLSKEGHATYKGFMPYYGIQSFERPNPYDLAEDAQLSEKSEEYLYKIIDYCKNHDLKLLLMVAPYISNSEQNAIYEQIGTIAEKTETSFINFNHYYDEIGIDFKTDYVDNSHVNYSGAMKFSYYLGYYLKEHYTLEDHRGQEKWRSWDLHVDAVEAEAAENN